MTEKILVVDDDPLMLQTLRLRLGDEGYLVQTAADGYSAVDICEENEFDLIICDVKMPGLDGLETLRRIRKDHPLGKSILITGYAETEAPIQAIRLGVSDYLFKPFED
jgi:CheY-like chemotaxis protein